MASGKKGCKVRVLVRLRPECPDFMDKASDGRNGNPDNCVRAVDASTLEVWNCRNPDESIQYRYVQSRPTKKNLTCFLIHEKSFKSQPPSLILDITKVQMKNNCF